MNQIHEDLDFVVKDITTSGFDIEIDTVYAEDILFSWHAFGVEGGKISVSDGSTEEIEIIIKDAQNQNEAENDVEYIEEIQGDVIAETETLLEDNVIETDVPEDNIADDQENVDDSNYEEVQDLTEEDSEEDEVISPLESTENEDSEIIEEQQIEEVSAGDIINEPENTQEDVVVQPVESVSTPPEADVIIENNI
ncbi:hypothetical protein KJ766_01035 [Patescibacteria group bacterium]|nr:hypothetical protein [Patescibacteria group bacterium]